ncbi:MAG: T9SS type A sorting domain-containing protein [Bacteroidetes bacterium]|nr:T9SS type A sorting domain-containing protein [Bacteroidota bacterium]
MTKEYIRTTGIIVICLFLSAWGGTGHYIINEQSVQSFEPELHQFIDWAVDLAEHASDADKRKSQDPNESPKHYIDIDNYPEFVSHGRIAGSIDSVISLHGESFVYEQGILPWATLNAYDSLVACFKRLDWDQALLFAADLGHYVADGHQPFHISRNYNGQYSGNYGIHSRYESSMINDFESEIKYKGKQIQLIADTRQYIFSYLYRNYTYVDSVLMADDNATLTAGNTSSSLYYSLLWEDTKWFTIDLFSKASHALAELIYSAWYEAGTPSINSGIFEMKDEITTMLFPNPAIEITHIYFSKSISSKQTIRIYDVEGGIVKQLNINHSQAENGGLQIDLSGIKSGLYFVLVNEEVAQLIVSKP